jgi:hypothetical protein
MLAELEKLVSLQRYELEIRALESRLKQIPVKIEELEKEVATERANVKNAEDRLNESKKSRRTFEGELELLEGKIGKYKDQLMLVKSNDEYKAMQKQIQVAEEEISTKEDLILVKMEEADEFALVLSKRNKELEEGLTHVHKLEAELETEASRLGEELNGKKAERETLSKSLPEDLLNLYQQIARSRSGIAVAEAKDQHCTVCNVRLRPQVYELLRLGESIQRCDNCTRILHLPPSEKNEE